MIPHIKNNCEVFIMLKNVIFDMGNVLLSYNPEIPLDLFCTTREAKDLIRSGFRAITDILPTRSAMSL